MLEAQRLHPIASIRDLVVQSDYRAGSQLHRYLGGLRKVGLSE